jgi:hypothetical protein
MPAATRREHTPDRIRAQIKGGRRRRDAKEVNLVFQRFSVPLPAAPKLRGLPHKSLRPALREFAILLEDHELADFLQAKGLSRAGLLSIDEFRQAVAPPPALTAWAASLPLAALLADALPTRPGGDPLRVLSQMAQREVASVADGVCDGLRTLLLQHVARLRTAFRTLERRTGRAARDGPAAKFEVVGANRGTLDDFHAGHRSRIGPPPVPPPRRVFRCPRAGNGRLPETRWKRARPPTPLRPPPGPEPALRGEPARAARRSRRGGPGPRRSRSARRARAARRGSMSARNVVRP